MIHDVLETRIGIYSNNVGRLAKHMHSVYQFPYTTDVRGSSMHPLPY